MRNSITYRKYSLEIYRGSKSRFTCPNCGQAKQFTRYVDENDNYLSDEIGICNRKTKCGYHNPPRNYFRDFGSPSSLRLKSKSLVPKIETPVKPDFIDFEVFAETINDEKNDFIEFLEEIFLDKLEAVKEAVDKYYIGKFEDGRTVFWQIDRKENIRTGKIIKYDSETGKRFKPIPPTWIHAELKNQGKISKDFNLKQCLFGEHLIIDEKQKPIAVVEAEKTAVIASIVFPEVLWMASGSINFLSVEKLKRLGQRSIILYPDANAFNHWQKIAKEAQRIGVNVKISSLIENRSTSAEKESGDDIADYLIKEQIIKRQFGIRDERK